MSTGASAVAAGLAEVAWLGFAVAAGLAVGMYVCMYAKRMTGSFYPRSASLGLSGPLWASASQPAPQPASQAHDRFPGRNPPSQPASQLASSLVVILLVGSM